MDSSKKGACPWGAPLTSTQWGSPVPSLVESSSNGSRQHSNSPGPGVQQPHAPNSSNLSGGYHEQSGDSQRGTPGSHSHTFHNQRPGPYNSHMQHSNRMRLPSLDNRGSPQSSPRHFQPRSRVPNSPRFGTPQGQYNPRFMNSPGNNFRPRGDFSPSPRQGFSSSGGRRSFTPRHGNPSNSVFDASQYVHPSMLEDPWRNLSPMPLLKQY